MAVNGCSCCICIARLMIAMKRNRSSMSFEWHNRRTAAPQCDSIDSKIRRHNSPKRNPHSACVDPCEMVLSMAFVICMMFRFILFDCHLHRVQYLFGEAPGGNEPATSFKQCNHNSHIIHGISSNKEQYKKCRAN